MTKISIIIPTYNRPDYLKRILDYYNGYKTDFQIIVADSSSDKNKARNKEIISSFPKLEILYFDSFSEKVGPSSKLANALNYVKSKYCLFCADDDFITLNGIKKSVDFLENNPDFTIVHGYYISFYPKTGKKGEKQFYWEPGYLPQSITFQDPMDRLTKHLSDYSVATFYGVHRTDFLKMIFKEMLDFTDDYRFEELLSTMLTLIYGKLKYLDVLYAAREVISSSSGNLSKNISDFIREGSYDRKYAKFRDCLAMHLSKKSNSTLEESKKVIDSAMSSYMKKLYPKTPKHFLLDKTKAVFDYLNLSDSAHKRMKSLYLKLALSKLTKNFTDSLDCLPIKYKDDFIRIRDCVVLHGKN